MSDNYQPTAAERAAMAAADATWGQPTVENKTRQSVDETATRGIQEEN
jgi:hypothetical protein